MSSFAVFVLIVIIIAAALGWMSGLIKQLGKVAGLIVGIIACHLFSPLFVSALCGTDVTGAERILYTILVYVVVFIVAFIGMMMAARIMKGILSKIHLGGLDALAGAVFKVALWMMLLSLALNLFVAVVPDTKMTDDEVFNRVLWFAPYILGLSL